MVTGARPGHGAPASAHAPAQASAYDNSPLDPFIFTVYATDLFPNSANVMFTSASFLSYLYRMTDIVFPVFLLFHCSALSPIAILDVLQV